MDSGEILLKLRLARDGFVLAVDLQLPANGISVVFGPSGCGKTTLLRCVAGLERGCRGLVRVGGQLWQDDAAGVSLATWRRDLGYVFQEASLFAHLDVRANLRYGLRRSANARSQDLAAAIELLGIGHLLARRVAGLSGGERQRVAIARALATRPALLLLDEPLAALDEARRAEIMPWLEALRRELSTPMLYVTHSMGELLRLADHLVIMQQGQVLASGAAAQVLAAGHAQVDYAQHASAVISATVAAREAQWHLLRLQFDGGSLWVADGGQPPGATMRVQIMARDVSVLRAPPQQSSIQNHLAAQVLGIEPSQEPSQAMVQLRCGSSVVLARITHKAVAALELQPGMPVWLQIKSVAVLS